MLVLGKGIEIESDNIIPDRVQIVATTTVSTQNMQLPPFESVQETFSVGVASVPMNEEIPIVTATMPEYALTSHNF